jgi:exonuclease VII small subunit
MKKKKKILTPSEQKIEEVMREFKEGELHSGKSDKIVTNRKQAIAIALSEAEKVEEDNAEKK